MDVRSSAVELARTLITNIKDMPRKWHKHQVADVLSTMVEVSPGLRDLFQQVRTLNGSG